MAIRLAVHAFSRNCLGAFALFYGFALFNDHYAFFAAFSQHLYSRKDTGRAGADYSHVIFFHNPVPFILN